MSDDMPPRTPSESASPAGQGAGPGPTGFREIFIGPNGIRAGWRLLIFIALVVGLIAATQRMLFAIPGVKAWVTSQPKNVMTPVNQIVGEGMVVVCLLIAAGIMTKIERRSFADYGLPLREAFGGRFWEGLPFGFAMVSLLLGLIAAFHDYSISGAAISGAEAAKDGILYAIGFGLVGVFEEFSFRGYMQSTLTQGMGFWPAAIVLSIAFGAIHLQNPGEAWLGAIMAGSFGIVAALSLQRTGSIWFAIGMHAAFDWGETYFYGVPDSGFVARGHLLNSQFFGSRWISGGSVGPEGSVFALLVLVLAAVFIHFMFPLRKPQASWRA
jgi:uncharacterized protein